MQPLSSPPPGASYSSTFRRCWMSKTVKYKIIPTYLDALAIRLTGCFSLMALCGLCPFPRQPRKRLSKSGAKFCGGKILARVILWYPTHDNAKNLFPDAVLFHFRLVCKWRMLQIKLYLVFTRKQWICIRKTHMYFIAILTRSKEKMPSSPAVKTKKEPFPVSFWTVEQHTACHIKTRTSTNCLTSL